MPRLALKVLGAASTTKWTLADHDDTRPYTPQVLDPTMQTNGHYYGHGQQASYGSYSASGYDSPESSRGSSAQWKGPSEAVNGHFDDFNFDTQLEDRASHQISLNTRIRSHNQDVVGQHLLYETALLDTQAFEMLDISEVDALKKEHERLNARIEASNRKLKLESKVKNAAQNIHKLYSVKKGARPDTPQSPESPKKSRNSLLGNRGRNGSGSSNGGQILHQTQDEVAQSIKMVDELNETIKELMERRQVVERQLLRHTAAVLAEQAQRVPEPVDSVHSNGHRDTDDDAMGAYNPNEFDSIRDILHGKPAGSSKLFKAEEVDRIQANHEEQLQSVQDRLEQMHSQLQGDHERHLESMRTRLDHLNSQLRGVITEANQSHDRELEPEVDSGNANDTATNLHNTLSRLEGNLQKLTTDREGSSAVEQHLQQVNTQLYNMLQSQDPQSAHDLEEPPQVTGQGDQHQLHYFQDSILTLEKLHHQHGEAIESAKAASGNTTQALAEAQSKAAMHAQRTSEYETVLSGLWDIISADTIPSHGSTDGSLTPGGSGSRSPRSPLKEDFSLPAFNSRVQHLFDIASNAREQQDILRRQIQQQRDLNGKSDVEKDREIAEWQNKHIALAQVHQDLQDDLAKTMVDHQQAEREVGENRGELMNVMNELEQLKRTMDSRMQERDEMARQVETYRGNAVGLQEQVAALEQQLSVHGDSAQQHAQLSEEKEAVQQKYDTLQKEMTDLESEVVRLTTELTIAKADLEGAYGTRAERQKEAGLQAGEVDALKQSNRQELDAIYRKHQESTAELQEKHQQVTAELESLRGKHVELQDHAQSIRTELSERSKMLESELAEMTGEFQEMTRESLELEKERGQLEGLIDGLRDRCDALEAQVSDEKVRWMGIKSPGGAPEAGQGREAMSVMVMRQEFKKMMRESRAEAVKLVRTEQEERRRLEAELRKLRQASGPLGRKGSQGSALNGFPQPPSTSGARPAALGAS